MPMPAALAVSVGIGALVYGTALWRTSTDSRRLAGQTLDWMVTRIGFQPAPASGAGSR
jgi:hypothetical protein